ncbi:hypothetical protein [Halochromatium glycolicum]|uniref:hypothetical protein n=1 Tax=Halochromatium glycolicum TaxID=85075 RepID=UPI00190C3F7A|nr:hypothetical protein [Halochromatium glycolicum]
MSGSQQSGQYVVASTVFPPAAVGVALAGSLWALVQGGKGWGRAKEQKLRQAQQELHAHLHSVRDQARRYYFDVDVGAGRLHNLVDTHFDDLAQQVGESVQQLASERSAEAQRELERLKQQAELDEKQRTERLGELRACLAEWDTLGKRLQRIVEQTQRLEQALSEETGGAQQDKPA